MSVIVSLIASEYGNLLRKLKTNREILICDAEIGLRVGWFFQGLGINGEEKRPFSDQEIESLVKHYKYYNAFFSKQGLLPIKKIKSMHTKLKENKIPEGEVKSSDQPSTQKLLLVPLSLPAEQIYDALVANLGILSPKEIQRLLKMRKIFEQKSELEKARHKHSWSPAIIPPSVATRNSQKTEVCFECGKIGKQFENAPPLTKMQWVKSFAKWLMDKNHSL